MLLIDEAVGIEGSPPLSSHPWDGQIPSANIGASRLSVGLATEGFHVLPVVNCIASGWPMAQVMRKGLDSITCAPLNQLLICAWANGEFVASPSVETRRKPLRHSNFHA